MAVNRSTDCPYGNTAVHTATDCADGVKDRNRTSSEASTCASDADLDGCNGWSDTCDFHVRQVTFVSPRLNEICFFEADAAYQAWRPKWYLDRRARNRKINHIRTLRGGVFSYESRMAMIAAEDVADEQIRLTIAVEDIAADTQCEDHAALPECADGADACESFDLRNVIVNMWDIFEMAVLAGESPMVVSC